MVLRLVRKGGGDRVIGDRPRWFGPGGLLGTDPGGLDCTTSAPVIYSRVPG